MVGAIWGDCIEIGRKVGFPSNASRAIDKDKLIGNPYGFQFLLFPFHSSLVRELIAGKAS